MHCCGFSRKYRSAEPFSIERKSNSQCAASRQSAYVALYREGLDPLVIRSIRDATYTGLPLASEALKRKLALELRRRVDPGRRGRPPKPRPGPDLENLEIGL